MAVRPSLLFVNQHDWPDVAATGRHLTDLAEHLADRFDEVCRAMERLDGEDGVEFVFVGGGPRAGEIRRCVEERGIRSFRYPDYFPGSASTSRSRWPTFTCSPRGPTWRGWPPPASSRASLPPAARRSWSGRWRPSPAGCSHLYDPLARHLAVVACVWIEPGRFSSGS